MNSDKKIDERVKEVLEDFARRAEERKELERAWLINLNYYNGNQYAECLPTGAICSVGRRYPWQSTSVFNHIAPIIEARLAKFNRMSSEISCLPASSSPGDGMAAKFATKLIRSVREENDFRALSGKAAYWAEICGTAFYKICWDKSKGRTVSADGLREGDVTVTVCPPQEIYPDSLSAAGTEDCRSIIHAKAYPVKTVEDSWGVKIRTDILKAGVLATGTDFDGENLFCGKEKDGFVLVIERYSLPTAEYPEGRLLIVAADKVLYDGALPYETESCGRRGFPFVRQVSIPAPASFFGGSLVERMIPIQKAYNAVKNRKHEFFNRLTAGVLLAEDGSVDVDDLDEEGIAPGKVIIYRQGCEKPEMVNFGSVPQEFGEEEDRLLKEFVTVSGVNDFLVTGAFTGLNYSGTALNIIMEQSNARLCVTTESIRTAERAVAAKILRIYKQFATDERLAAVENSSYGESAAFRASDISADDIVFNLDDGQINSLTDRRGLAKEICEMNLLADKDGNISDESKRKLLELLGCEGFATTRNTDELHRGRAAKENESVGKERLKTDNLDDHEIHIAEHTAYLLSDASGIGETEKQILGNHIAEHRAMIAGNNA